MAVQQQQEKPRPKVPRRSSVLEIVLGTLHLLMGGSFVGIFLVALQNDGMGSSRVWYDLAANICAFLMALFTSLAGMLLLFRQRRTAGWLQWISAFAALFMSALVIYSSLKAHALPLTNYEWILLAIFSVVPLWMFGFAWFLKKQESET